MGFVVPGKFIGKQSETKILSHPVFATGIAVPAKTNRASVVVQS